MRRRAGTETGVEHVLNPVQLPRVGPAGTASTTSAASWPPDRKSACEHADRPEIPG